MRLCASPIGRHQTLRATVRVESPQVLCDAPIRFGTQRPISPLNGYRGRYSVNPRDFSAVAFYPNPISGTKRQLQNASERR